MDGKKNGSDTEEIAATDGEDGRVPRQMSLLPKIFSSKYSFSTTKYLVAYIIKFLLLNIQ